MVVTLEKIASMIAEIMEKLNEHDDRFDRMDTRFDAMDTRFDAMDARFVAMDTKIDEMHERLRNVERDVLALRKDYDSLEAKVADQALFAREIDHVLNRIRAIESKLGIKPAVRGK